MQAMFTPDQYQLLDFGLGRRLESFAGIRVDRPCPAAEGIGRARPEIWDTADARFDRQGGEEQRGQWHATGNLPPRWTISCGRIVLALKPTQVGQLGLFPEQAENWDWIARQVAAAGEPIRVLNLFAYTGGSTLAAAAAGAEVVHVDAARNMVAWARRNAELSGLAEAPIRWLVEDAMLFVRREIRRGNRYHAVILDPPSYGHGPHGRVWRLAQNLERLLALCAELTACQRRFLLLSCHTPGFGPARLRDLVVDALGAETAGQASGVPLTLRSSAGRDLSSGVVVRVGS
jgi:23S rRNA (cytosine1962-C5)-methyltransferase